MVCTTGKYLCYTTIYQVPGTDYYTTRYVLQLKTNMINFGEEAIPRLRRQGSYSCIGILL